MWELWKRRLEAMVRQFRLNGSAAEAAANLSRLLELGEPDAPDEGCVPFLEFLDLFHTFYTPTIIFVGLVGNFLSSLVFLSSHLRMRSSSYYLAALACADFGFLLSLLFVWINDSTGIQVFNKEGWCQWLVYSSSVCSFLSVWLIVAFTVERYIAVQYPLRRPQMCTVARAKSVVLSLVGVALVSHGYSFLTAGMTRTADGDEVCDLRDEYAETMRLINVVDSLLTLILPLILIVFMNCMITRKLIKFNRRFRHDVSLERFSRNEFSLHRLTRASSIHGRHLSDTSNSQDPRLQRSRTMRILRAFSNPTVTYL